MKNFRVLLGLQLLALVYSAQLSAPRTPTCYRNDEKLENCLLRVTELIKPYFREGFPALQIPVLDPLVLSTLDVSQKTDQYGFKIHLEDFTVAGLRDYRFEKLRYDPETFTLYGRVFTEPILISGRFRVKGTVVLVPVDTEGRFSAAMGPIMTNFTIRANPEARNDDTYLDIDKVQLKMSIEDIAVESFNIENAGYNLAHASVVKMFNENSKLILPGLTPVIEELFGQLVGQYVSKITAAIPYDKLLPML